jgi:hypothetical protein
MVAALFVAEGGAYYGIPDVDPWPESRDARLYEGPWPCVAHPPCERWGRYWSGGPSAKVKRIKGDDGGCFKAALEAVERWGGVLEHPEASHAWEAFGIPEPERGKGWQFASGIRGWRPDSRPAWTCCVEQGHYGHRARKATWLFAVLPRYPELIWTPSSGERLDEGFHSTEERRAARAAGAKPCPRLSAVENLATPPAFRDLLLDMARSVSAPRKLAVEGT